MTFDQLQKVQMRLNWLCDKRYFVHFETILFDLFQYLVKLPIAEYKVSFKLPVLENHLKKEISC